MPKFIAILSVFFILNFSLSAVGAENMVSPTPDASASVAATPKSAALPTREFNPTVDYRPQCDETTSAINKVPTSSTVLDEATQFAALRNARQDLWRASQMALSAREILKNTAYEMRREDILRNFSLPSSSSNSEDDLQGEMMKLENEEGSIRQKIKEGTNDTNAEKYSPDLERIKKNRIELKVEILKMEKRNKSAAENEKRVEEASQHNIKMSLRNEKSLQEANSDIECFSALQNKIDGLIYATLIPQTQKNQFKLWMSGIFAFMVLVVILGFFTVALRDSGVRSAIFSNQTGIQFVTLFSLVIAIILFGITGILEAKELSALLGGISGYILGRVTTERAQVPQAGTPSRSVTGNTVTFNAPNSIRKPEGGFDGYAQNQKIRVRGSMQNDGEYTVLQASHSELLVAEPTIKNETAGPTVSLSTT